MMMDFTCLRDFYKKQIFTDLDIFVINEESSQWVCKCHRLLFASLFPGLKVVLKEDDCEAIFIENGKIDEIKSSVDAIYDSVGKGQYPNEENVAIFKEWMLETVANFFASLHELNENPFDGRLLKAKFIEKNYETQKHVPRRFEMLISVQTHANLLKAKPLASKLNDSPVMSDSKIIGNMINMAREYFSLSIEELLELIDTNNGQVNFVPKPPITIDFANLSETITFTFTEEEFSQSDFFVLSGDEISNLYVQPFFKYGIANFESFVKLWASFCQAQNLNDIMLIKALRKIYDSSAKKENSEEIVENCSVEPQKKTKNEARKAIDPVDLRYSS